MSIWLIAKWPIVPLAIPTVNLPVSSLLNSLCGSNSGNQQLSNLTFFQHQCAHRVICLKGKRTVNQTSNAKNLKDGEECGTRDPVSYTSLTSWTSLLQQATVPFHSPSPFTTSTQSVTNFCCWFLLNAICILPLLPCLSATTLSDMAKPWWLKSPRRPYIYPSGRNGEMKGSTQLSFGYVFLFTNHGSFPDTIQTKLLWSFN